MRTQVDQGSRGDIIRSTNFVADHLVPTLNGFHRALAVRWQRLVADTIVAGRWDYPTRIAREGAPYVAPIAPPNEWTFSSKPARLHIDVGYCSTLRQVLSGEYDAENLASCDGAVLPEPGVEPGDPEAANGEVPQYIDCRVKSLLQEVVNWSWAERDHLLEQLLMFDRHDFDALEQARADLRTLGEHLTLNQSATSSDEEDGVDLGLSDLGVVVSQFAGTGRAHPDWWDEWTGLLASEAKNGFSRRSRPR